MRLASQRITELAGHKKRVSSVTWSPGGLKLASAGVEQQVRLHDVEHGAGAGKSTALSGHASSVEQLRFDPSRQGGDRLVSVSFDKMVKIWDVRSGKCSTTIDMKTALMNAAWSPSGAHIAVGNKDDVISIIDTKTMKVVWEQKFNFEVNQMVWAPNGKDFLVAARKGEDGTMEKLTFDETTGSLTSQSSNFGHHGGCYCIDVDPKGDFVATGAADAIVAMWDSKTNFCFDTVVRLDCPIRSVSFSHDSKYLASASEDLFMDVADAHRGLHGKNQEQRTDEHGRIPSEGIGDGVCRRLWDDSPLDGIHRRHDGVEKYSTVVVVLNTHI